MMAATMPSTIVGVPLVPPDKQPVGVTIPHLEKKVGYALVGLGQLCLEEIMPAFGAATRSRPVALVTGHADKGKAVAEAYGIPSKSIYSYSDYEKLADNAEVRQ